MKLPHSPHLRLLALAAAMGATGQAVAQMPRTQVEEPKMFKLHLTEVDTGVYAEGNFEQNSLRQSDTTLTHSRFFIGPSLGVSAIGSIYHPNLFSYKLNSEGAYGYMEEEIKTQNSTQHRSEWQYLGRFSGTADILPYKPLKGTLYGGYDHSYRDYDFFNRVTVDSVRYGARANYNHGPFFLTANFSHREEDITGLIQASLAKDDVLSLDARHERQRGASSINYSYTQYSRTDGAVLSEGRDQTVSLADHEDFGARKQFRLNSSGSYSHRDATFEKVDQITGQSTFEAEYTDHLGSFTELNYNRFKRDAYLSDNYIGHTELRHKLYDSLTSRLIAEGSDFEESDGINQGFTRRFGGGIAESYNKRLGTEHNLRIDESVMLEHTDQQTISSVQNERHSFSEAVAGPLGSFFLNQFNVNETSIVVRDQAGIQVFSRGLDYDVIQNGNRTLIQRISGSQIPENGIVLVDYTAEPSPAGGYESLSEFLQVRVDLWKQLWGIYGRLNLSLNNAPERLRVQNLKAYTFGTDVKWRWLLAGGEYTIYDSDQSQYNSARLYQNFTFTLDPASTVSFSFTESWTDYIDAKRKEQDYRFITRYRHAFTTHFGFDFEAGVDVRRGPGVDQLLATARPGIQYNIGKLSVKAEYDFEYNLFQSNEERVKHLFFIRAKRVF